MLKRILLITGLFFAGIFAAHSQQITGKVTSPEDPLGVPGVNIIIKGKQVGTTTDIDGNFTINAQPSDTLVISFVGLQTQEIAVLNQTHLTVELLPETRLITEVVVTALGIKRDEKALGYSVQKVAGDDIAKVKEMDVVNALSGKVAGVNISQGDGSIGGGGSRIVIRGESSLAGNNDPLYIINGIPGGPNDVASDDIESISVLKGAAAAALYGSKAGAGVVLITTKSGKSSTKDIQIEVNSNVTFQSPLVLPKYQNSFGQGKSGKYIYFDGNNGEGGVNDDINLNWGPAFDGQLRPQFTGNDPWTGHPNNVKDFYELGHIAVNNISFAKATEKNNYRVSYTNTNQKGIMPNNGLIENRFDLNSNFTVIRNLTLNAGINYIHTDCPNFHTVDVRFIPRNIDIAALKNYWIPGMEGEQQLNYRRSGNNPYFELYENPEGFVRNRTIVNLSTNYDDNKGLNIIGRYGMIYYNEDWFQKKAKSTYTNNSDSKNGYYRKGFANTKETTAEFLASFSKKIISSITYKLSFGGTHYRREYNKLENEIFGLYFTDIYNINNRTQTPYVNDWKDELERNSLYGFLNLDYKSKIYLDITGRNDWSSTLSKNNNSFFYPSVALSALMNEIFRLPDQVFSFWKLRGSWAQVGKDIPNPYFITPEKHYWITNAQTGRVTIGLSNIWTDPNLKPELTTGWEIGSDIRFLQNRLGLDVTAYYSTTVNQILKSEVSSTTGYDYYMMNAGQISGKGLEVTINATPLRKKDFEWKTQLNWSIDRTYVDNLIDSLPDKSKTQSVNNFLAIEDRKGQRRGTFYGKDWRRSPDGEQLFTYSGDTRETGYIALGNYNPDWMLSFNNTITYKNLDISFLLDLRYGGKIYNNIERLLDFDGLSDVTTLNNRESLVPNGVVEDESGTGYRKLTLQDLINYGKPNGQTGEEYWANMTNEGIPGAYMQDDTYLKLREARIAYEIPKKYLTKLYVKSVTVALVGRNLAVWSKIKHIDPETFGYSSETSDFGSYSKIPGYANSSVPSVRSYGFALSIKF
jgi:TonB-linked SusC/RagA family outer membrane protein